MFGKIKKTLGRRKPLEDISVPNAIIPPPAPPDERAAMKDHFNSILADSETLEWHYKEMLSSRGTSEFARGQMTQLPDATKRELVRMWLMSRPENLPRGRPDVASPNRKRAHSDASAVSSSEDETKRQKTEKRHTVFDIATSTKDDDSGRTKSTDNGSSPRPNKSSGPVADVQGRVEPDENDRPESSSSSGSQESIPRTWVEDVKHMRHVITNRDEYDPKVTKDMDFEKMIIRLRLFLRAESIKRLLQFIDTGGLVSLVGVVNGILDVEWREQHETRFLLGILHCIRIILKTHEGANRFFSLGQHDVLFPRLVRMQFSWGEERRAFFRFDHRAVITEIFFYWIRNVNHQSSSLPGRANRMLEFLQDFPDKEKQHHDIISVMHKVRRYKNWHKEVKNTTQPWLGTPWMYYHKENVIPPRQQDLKQSRRDFSEEFAPTRRPELISSTVRSHTETLVAHYVAANLDLMNICLVAQPDKARRNALRQEFADCGFEDLFGSKLRLASQVNFPCIDSTLRDWVTAAKVDNWPVAHVTAIPESSSPEKSSFARGPASKSPSGLPQGLLNFDVLEDTPFDL